MLKVPTDFTHIRPGVVSGEDSSILNIVEEPLSVEEGYGFIHIEVPHALDNDIGLVLSIVLVFPQMVQIPSV